MHLLVQSVSGYSSTKIVRTARESHGPGDIQASASGQAEAVGRRVLVEGLLHHHGREARKRGDGTAVSGAAGSRDRM